MEPLLILGADPLGHTLDKELLGSGLFALTMNTLTLFLGGFLWLWIMNVAANAIATGPESSGHERYVTRGRLAQVVEVVVLYLRDNIIKPQLGPDTRKFMPFLLSLFFFIWVNNLLGLVPLLDLQHLIGLLWGDPKFAVIGGTPTGRLATNAALALVAFILWHWNGIKSNGVGGWLHHFLGGAPWYLAPIMIPVEIIGTIVKPAALVIRLFANMTAGHVLLAAIITAGRSGSAFTAEIGSMKANEEIDAMRTLGIDPIEVLVVPRVIAFVFMLPILAFIGNVMGIFGGMLVSWAVLDVSPGVFFSRMVELVPLDHFWVGLIKAPFFAWGVALIGCQEGLAVEGSAESVGRRTTRSVVQAIFNVIVLDALFAMLFLEINF